VPQKNNKVNGHFQEIFLFSQTHNHGACDIFHYGDTSKHPLEGRGWTRQSLATLFLTYGFLAVGIGPFFPQKHEAQYGRFFERTFSGRSPLLLGLRGHNSSQSFFDLIWMYPARGRTKNALGMAARGRS
jgi:hypothetical protein